MRLIDGHRGVEMPVCYLKRAKITAGEYLIFYRVAFRHEPKQSGSPQRTAGRGAAKLASPGSVLSSKGLTSNMDDANDMSNGN